MNHKKRTINSVKDATLDSMHAELMISVINVIRSDTPPKVLLEIGALLKRKECAVNMINRSQRRLYKCLNGNGWVPK